MLIARYQSEGWHGNRVLDSAVRDEARDLSRIEKKGFSLIPTSGDRAKANDCYVVYLLDETGEARFLVEKLEGDECWFPRRTEPVRRIISIEN